MYIEQDRFVIKILAFELTNFQYLCLLLNNMNMVGFFVFCFVKYGLSCFNPTFRVNMGASKQIPLPAV